MGRGGGGGDFGSGSGSKFNCAARVGSDDLGYGPGLGFSFEPVQTSNRCRKKCAGFQSLRQLTLTLDDLVTINNVL